MKIKGNTILFHLILTILSVYAGEQDIAPQPMPTPRTTSTIEPPTTTASTTSTAKTPTTSITTTTSSTSKPTTISTTTTTVKPPTSSPTTSTTTTVKPTTSSPSTTTIAPLTSTVKPTPLPDPPTGNWSVNYPTTNRSCIVMNVAVQLEMYPNTNKTVKINLPINATSSGDCGNISQTITLKWNNDSLKFQFSKMANISKFELQTVTFNILTGAGNQTLYHHKSEFQTPLTNSYKCTKVQTFNLTDHANVTSGYLYISHLQLEAFRNTSSHNFDSAIDCEGSLTSDVVPIVVGCVLAGLVVAVLVAYLIGRRRCQARGYLSM